jgi:hypothetical protein
VFLIQNKICHGVPPVSFSLSAPGLLISTLSPPGVPHIAPADPLPCSKLAAAVRCLTRLAAVFERRVAATVRSHVPPPLFELAVVSTGKRRRTGSSMKPHRSLLIAPPPPQQSVHRRCPFRPDHRRLVAPPHCRSDSSGLKSPSPPFDKPHRAAASSSVLVAASPLPLPRSSLPSTKPVAASPFELSTAALAVYPVRR